MNEKQIRDLLKESIENSLNDFYHERIVPLEKQIIKLGGITKKAPNVIEFKFRMFNPINAFKDTSNHFWDDPESNYYKFFSLLFKAVLDRGWKGYVDKIISGVNGSVIVLSGKAEGVNGEYNNDYIWLYSINEEGKVSSITEYLSDILFVKQLYGQEICGEKKTM